MYRTIGIVARTTGEQVQESVSAVLAALTRRDRIPVVEDATAQMLGEGGYEPVPRGELGDRCDLVVVVGGDGSLLGVARDLCHSGVPVLGINRGGLGFLAGVAPDLIEQELAAVLDGKHVTEDHFLLDASVSANGGPAQDSLALNDVVVHAGASRMLEFSVWVNDEWLYDQRGDGLIVASPTGSTAYALSAGGPIMHPSLDAIAIVPMFPHTLTSRPLVVPGKSVIKVQIANADSSEARASCDSQVQLPIHDETELIIHKAPDPLKLVFPMDHSFYESCRSKLDWATRLGGKS